ncbi:MAG: hypothetical protein AABY68_05620 [Pseudomonadota bacterium]
MDTLPLRQLAIRLACIHADDRAWILAQLGRLEREQMDELLMEIADLGLNKNPAVLAALYAEPMPRFAMASVMPEDIALHPQISQLQHPYWRALLLQMHDPSQRRKAMDVLPQGALIRRWDHAWSEQAVPPALLTALARHVAVAEVSHVEP